jgi:hypothetical protein
MRNGSLASTSGIAGLVRARSSQGEISTARVGWGQTRAGQALRHAQSQASAGGVAHDRDLACVQVAEQVGGRRQ